MWGMHPNSLYPDKYTHYPLNFFRITGTLIPVYQLIKLKYRIHNKPDHGVPYNLKIHLSN